MTPGLHRFPFSLMDLISTLLQLPLVMEGA
jgi:hypothetical protein